MSRRATSACVSRARTSASLSRDAERLQKQDGFEPGTKLQAWLFTIMRNLFYSGYRKHKREVEDVDGLYAAKLSTLPEEPGCVEFAALRLALSQLSDEQREAVLLVGAEGLTYEETAEVCGT